MLRSMILALVLGVFLFGGCYSPANTETPDPAPVQERPVEISPSEPAQTPSKPAGVEEVPTEQPTQPQPEELRCSIPSGVWLAGTDVGYSNYYEFDADTQSGRFVSLEYGLGMDFTYTGDDSALVFTMEGYEQPLSAAVEEDGEDGFTLLWEDSLPEKLTFVDEGSLDEFHFYSNADLAELSMEHYARLHTGELPQQSGTLTNEDNTVTVQLYDNVDGHNSTAAWYIVDRFTATGIDLNTGDEIDLLFDAADMELPEEELPTEALPEEEISTEPDTPVEESTEEIPTETTNDLA